MEKELRVRPIKNGTVIDHLTAGLALKVVKILGIDETIKEVVSIVMNVSSESMGKKDIVKVENRELNSDEVDKISLIAPKATINIIRDHEIVEKHRVSLPDTVEEFIECPNSKCITNTNEPIKSKFKVINEKEVKLKCEYCQRTIKGEITGYIKKP
ncbi:MAG: Aspartate carbamoyltransferase regulatory subunit PyrI [Candidatus Methanohalarchaeum thermophilum]|uniref:Aspartate carbamoyltransferase regulatory chain n=1 Tax=Methanohalarchaeum thermophilum TaxID=1903181 RepID=A0A1Q6DU03_METT1|nr:MAG: Aspartate carbamoyltransferase regulatory subunit PyrI [Candidatus Methanohalarchaeum thermophilum]